MKNAILSFLNSLAGLLGPLSNFAKAIVPAALALAVAVVNSVAAGSINSTSITIGVSGLVLAIVTYLIPNVQQS